MADLAEEEVLLGVGPKNFTWCTDLTTEDPKQVFCVIMQTYTIGNSKVRIYDIGVLFLNLLFIVFLLLKVVPTVRKLRLSWPLFTIIYCLIFLIPFVSNLRSILAMGFGHGKLPAKITHYILRGIILTTEMSVVVFGLAIKFFIDSRLKLIATMIIISLIAIVFTVTQFLMDILGIYEPLVCKTHNLFTHGGMIFVFAFSTLFAIIYMCIFGLYVSRLYKRWDLPTKMSFYRYALFLSIVNGVQSIGSMLWFYGTRHQVMGHFGVCLVMVTSLIYLVTFAPVVYWIFLSNYFRMTNVTSTTGPTGKSAVNMNREDSVTFRTRWWRWSLKSKSIHVPSFDSEETSKLINKSTPSSAESSYSSTSSAEDISHILPRH